MRHSFKKGKDHVVMTLSGKYKHEIFMGYPEKILAECNRHNMKRVLVDARKMNGPVSTIERYSLGEQIAKILSFKIRLAVIWVPEEINHFAETVAVNRGGNMRMFVDSEAAISWLVE